MHCLPVRASIPPRRSRRAGTWKRPRTDRATREPHNPRGSNSWRRMAAGLICRCQPGPDRPRRCDHLGGTIAKFCGCFVAQSNDLQCGNLTRRQSRGNCLGRLAHPEQDDAPTFYRGSVHPRSLSGREDHLLAEVFVSASCREVKAPWLHPQRQRNRAAATGHYHHISPIGFRLYSDREEREAVLAAESSFRYVDLHCFGIARRLDYFYVQLRGLIAGFGPSENNQGHLRDVVGPHLAGRQYATPDIQLVVHCSCSFSEECAGEDHPSNVQEVVRNHGAGLPAPPVSGQTADAGAKAPTGTSPGITFGHRAG